MRLGVVRLLDTRAGSRAGPTFSAHPDTDAQHGWMLQTFGIDTRDVSLGMGQAAGHPQAGAGRVPGTELPAPKTFLDTASSTDSSALGAKLTALLTPFKDRVSALGDPEVVFEKTFETKQAYGKYQELVEAAVHAAAEGKNTDAVMGNIEAATQGLEHLVADLPKKAKAATAEAARISRMTEAALLNTGVAQKVNMVETLLAAGTPSGAIKAAQIKVYRAMLLDPGFVNEDEARGRQIAADLQGDVELETARNRWGATSEDEKLQALRKVVAAQSRRLGIASPELVVEHIPVTEVVTVAEFNEEDGKLYINMDSSSGIGNFEFALNAAIHENAHNYQKQLVQKLDEGQLTPGMPDYIQATMFRVNRLEPGGYIQGTRSAELHAYQDQPLERHSMATGPATAAEIVKVL